MSSTSETDIIHAIIKMSSIVTIFLNTIKTLFEHLNTERVTRKRTAKTKTVKAALPNNKSKMNLSLESNKPRKQTEEKLPPNNSRITRNKSNKMKTNIAAVINKSKKNVLYKIYDNENERPKENKENVAVYEFTYDPSDEPPPQKKKRKRNAAKKKPPAKPKLYFYNNNYDKTLSKTLDTLKSKMFQKSKQVLQEHNIIVTTAKELINNKPLTTQNTPITVPSNLDRVTECNINYSPVMSPRPQTPGEQTPRPQTPGAPIPRPQTAKAQTSGVLTPRPQTSGEQTPRPQTCNEQKSRPKTSGEQTPRPQACNEQTPWSQTPRPQTPGEQSCDEQTFRPQTRVGSITDPLNLQEDSFFDEPIACSSFNTSTKHPLASPWRVDTDLRLKFPVNMYVKPNMTPAFDSSFINEPEQANTAKKHVYTNILTDTGTREVDIEPPKLIQTGIVSFVREMVQRNMKKKRKSNQTPTKNKSVVDDSFKLDICDNRDKDDDDDQSVHLFEDIELVHHVKLNRKSYGKAKKVAFNQQSKSEVESQDKVENSDTALDEDYENNTFKIPTVKTRRVVTRKRKAPKLSKKEEEEADAWAAGFNSMCEDVDGFSLVVE